MKDPQMGAKGRQWMREQGRIRKRIVEVGVFEGNGTALLAACGAKVWAVDRWTDPEGNPRDEMYDRVRARFSWAIKRGNVSLIRGDSVAAAAELLVSPGRVFDLAFIDGDHSYEGCRRDIEAYKRLVKKGGTLSGHDYHAAWPGVVRAVDEAFGGRARVSHGSIWQVQL